MIAGVIKYLAIKNMSSRADIARGRGPPRSNIKSYQVPKQAAKIEPAPKSTLPTIVLPPARKMCAILLFFLGSFAIGFGAGFGSGYGSKTCS